MSSSSSHAGHSAQPDPSAGGPGEGGRPQPARQAVVHFGHTRLNLGCARASSRPAQRAPWGAPRGAHQGPSGPWDSQTCVWERGGGHGGRGENGRLGAGDEGDGGDYAIVPRPVNEVCAPPKAEFASPRSQREPATPTCAVEAYRALPRWDSGGREAGDRGSDPVGPASAHLAAVGREGAPSSAGMLSLPSPHLATAGPRPAGPPSRPAAYTGSGTAANIWLSRWLRPVVPIAAPPAAPRAVPPAQPGSVFLASRQAGSGAGGASGTGSGHRRTAMLGEAHLRFSMGRGGPREEARLDATGRSPAAMQH